MAVHDIDINGTPEKLIENKEVPFVPEKDILSLIENLAKNGGTGSEGWDSFEVDFEGIIISNEFNYMTDGNYTGKPFYVYQTLSNGDIKRGICILGYVSSGTQETGIFYYNGKISNCRISFSQNKYRFLDYNSFTAISPFSLNEKYLETYNSTANIEPNILISENGTFIPVPVRSSGLDSTLDIVDITEGMSMLNTIITAMKQYADATSGTTVTKYIEDQTLATALMAFVIKASQDVSSKKQLAIRVDDTICVTTEYNVNSSSGYAVFKMKDVDAASNKIYDLKMIPTMSGKTYLQCISYTAASLF